MRLMRAISAAAVGVLVTTVCSAQESEFTADFDFVWERVRDTHFDPDLNGVDWDAIRCRKLQQRESKKSWRRSARHFRRMAAIWSSWASTKQMV